MSGCVPCAERNATLLTSKKWGRCAFCIALAAGGSVMGWALTIALSYSQVDPRVTILFAAAASLFTLVLAGHAGAFFWQRRTRAG